MNSKSIQTLLSIVEALKEHVWSVAFDNAFKETLVGSRGHQ
jgi:hypothetical protein